jgi:vancomycin resistance protein YoaR
MKIRIHKEKLDKLIRLRNVLIGIVVFLAIVLFLFFLNIINTNKMSWGTKIAGISVSGLTIEKAQEKLNKASEQFLNQDLSLTYKNSHWQAAPKNLGIKIDAENTIKTVFDYSHQGKNFLLSAFWQFKSLLGCNFKPIWSINDEELENFFENNLSSIHQPAQNSMLVYDEGKKDFIVTASRNGVIIDKNKFKKDLAKIINDFEKKDIPLNLIKDYPEVVESETQDAYRKATSLLAILPIKITTEDNKEITAMNKDDFLSLVDFKPTEDRQNPNNKILGIELNKEKTKSYLVYLAPSINHEPIDAKFTSKDNRVIAFALSEDGVKLEIENNIPILEQGILNGKKEIQVKISVIKPKITSESINNLGITTFLATGTSDFSGSPNNRIHNIKVGAAKFNGVLIKPDEKFSFNDTLGEVGPEQGYEPELVIKRDKTVPEYGGGLCQVSTTLFRAAVNSGLKIIERYPHAFPVKYYNPQGFDATIYPPSPDLKFINNTPGYILIQAKINGQNLSFEFYGTSDGRKIVIEGPTQYDINADGSMKAKLVQKVYDKNGNLVIDKTFNSTYKSPSLYPVERNPLE